MSFNKNRSSPKQKKRQSLGRIYTTKRQPLTQINYYPKSVLIDEYFLQHPSHIRSDSSQVKQKKPKQKVIKFIGCQQQNIQLIIKSMDSLQQSINRIFMDRQLINVQQQITQILKIFYSKIDKLRMQRQSYKLAYHNEKEQRLINLSEVQKQKSKLSQQVMNLRRQHEVLIQNYQNEKKKRLFYERQCMMLQQRTKLTNNLNNQTVAESFDLVNRSVIDDNFFMQSEVNDNNYSRNQHSNHHNQRFSSSNNKNIESDQNQHSLFIKPVLINKNKNSINKQSNLMTYQSQSQSNLIETQPDQQIKNKITHEQKKKLQILLKKHNLHPNQLGDIIQEYLKDLKQQYQKQFQNQEEKRLYLLAKKIDAKVWNKKVKKDIEKIISSKESIKIRD